MRQDKKIRPWSTAHNVKQVSQSRKELIEYERSVKTLGNKKESRPGTTTESCPYTSSKVPFKNAQSSKSLKNQENSPCLLPS